MLKQKHKIAMLETVLIGLIGSRGGHALLLAVKDFEAVLENASEIFPTCVLGMGLKLKVNPV